MPNLRKTRRSKKINKYFSKKLIYITSTVLSVLLVVGTTQAVTTLGLSVSTDGTLTVNGSSTLGDASSDTVTVNAQVSSSLTPSTNNSRDLGAFGNAWRDVYTSSSLQVGSGAASSTLSSSGNLTLTGSVLGASTNSSDLGSLGNAFRNLFASSSVNVGSGAASSTLSSSGNLTLTGKVLPGSNNSSDLGSSSGTAFRSIYASSSLVVGGQVATNTIDFRTGSSAQGKGTCLVLTGTNGTIYYVSVTSTGQGNLQISTVSCL